MKSIIISIMIFGAFAVGAQSTSQTNDDYPKKLSVGKKPVSKNKTDQETYVRTLEDVNRDIKNIEVKMKHIKENPTEDQIAQQEGWYEKMNTRLEYLYAERKKHLNSKKK